MDEVATKIIEILRKNMKDPSKTVTLETPLSDLEIESLDLAVIVFDIEDTLASKFRIMRTKRLKRSRRSGPLSIA